MSEALWAVVFVLSSFVVWGYWAVGLFTDTRLRRTIRALPSITKRRPDLSLLFPAAAAILLSVGGMTVVEALGGPAEVATVFGALGLILVIAAVAVYWLPIRLPDWLDPAWQEACFAARRSK